MEIKKNERKGPVSEQKWGTSKYLSVEILFEKSATIQGSTTRVSGVLGQKLGYDSPHHRMSMHETQHF